MLKLVAALAVAAGLYDGAGAKNLPLAKRQEAHAGYINVTASNVSSVSVNVLTKTGQKNDTAPLLYGWMFEDISVSSPESGRRWCQMGLTACLAQR